MDSINTFELDPSGIDVANATVHTHRKRRSPTMGNARVTVTQSVVNGNDSITVKDSGAKVTAGAGCTGAPVRCDLGKLTKVVVDLGNRTTRSTLRRCR